MEADQDHHAPDYVLDVKYWFEGILTPLVGSVGLVGRLILF